MKRGKHPTRLLFCLLAGCTPHISHTSAFLDRDHDVYAAVLDSLFRPGAIGRLTIFETTSTTADPGAQVRTASLLFRLSGVDSATVRNFEQRNRERRSLTGLRKLPLRVPVVWADQEALKIPGNDPDKIMIQVRQLYPESRSIVTLSSIGYNEKGDMAVLMVDDGWCGGLCGSGSMMALRRINEKWVITEMQGTWIS